MLCRKIIDIGIDIRMKHNKYTVQEDRTIPACYAQCYKK